MIAPIKTKQLELLYHPVANASAILLASFSGIKSNEFNSIRSIARSHGATIIICKNTISKIALKEYSSLAKNLTQNRALVFINSLESCKELDKELEAICPKFQITHFLAAKEELGGGLPEYKAFLKLPSKPQLIANIAQQVSSPLTSVQSIITSPIRNLILVLGNLKDNFDKISKS